MANENSIDIHYSSYSIGSKFDVIRHALTFGADEISPGMCNSIAHMVEEVQNEFNVICQHYMDKEDRCKK